EDSRFYVGQTEVPRETLLSAIEAEKGERTARVLRADEKATVGQFALAANYAKAHHLRVLIATERGSLRPIGAAPVRTGSRLRPRRLRAWGRAARLSGARGWRR